LEIARTGRLLSILEAGATVLFHLVTQSEWKVQELILQICWEGFLAIESIVELTWVVNSEIFVMMTAMGCYWESLLPRVLNALKVIGESALNILIDTGRLSAMEFLGELLNNEDIEIVQQAEFVLNLYTITK
jgi:hypothetical protein